VLTSRTEYARRKMIFLQLSIYFLRSVMNLLVLSSSLKKFSNYANCMGCRGRHPLQKQTYWCGMSRTPSPTEKTYWCGTSRTPSPTETNASVRNVEDAIPYILLCKDAAPYRNAAGNINVTQRDVEDAVPYSLLRKDAIPYGMSHPNRLV